MHAFAILNHSCIYLGSGFECYVKLYGLEDWKLVCYYLGNERVSEQVKCRC